MGQDTLLGVGLKEKEALEETEALALCEGVDVGDPEWQLEEARVNVTTGV